MKGYGLVMYIRLAIGALVLTTSTNLAVAQVPFEVVALEGRPTATAEGIVEFTSVVGFPLINERGEVSFEAVTADSRGVCVGPPGALRQIPFASADGGLYLPAANRRFFQDDGATLFNSIPSGGNVEETIGLERCWLLAGLPAATFGIAPGRITTFAASSSGSLIVATTDNDSYDLLWSGEFGTLKPLIQGGDLAPGYDDGSRLRPSFVHDILAASGRYFLFEGSVDDPESLTQIFLFDGNDVRLVVKTGDPMPDGSGEFSHGLWKFDINQSGRLAFVDSGDTDGDKVLVGDSGGLSVVSLVGNAAEGVRFPDVEALFMLDNDQIMVLVEPYGTGHFGLYLGPQDHLAFLGDLPGSVSYIPMYEGFHTSRNGAFVAYIAREVEDNSSPFVLWGGPPSNVQRIVGPGDEIVVAPGDVRVVDRVSGTNLVRRDRAHWRTHQIVNDRGEIAVRLSFQPVLPAIPQANGVFIVRLDETELAPAPDDCIGFEPEPLPGPPGTPDPSAPPTNGSGATCGAVGLLPMFFIAILLQTTRDSSRRINVQR